MYYGEIKKVDIANGPGCRVSLFVSGCRNHCPGCFNPETWDFKYGKEYTGETEQKILELMNPPYIRGLTLLGGDPFEPENQRCLLLLLQNARKFHTDKDIWAYTGYTLEKLLSGNGHPCCEVTEKMLELIDVLVDGPFVQSRKNISLRFRGSENQRVIDLRESLKTGKITLSHFMHRD